MATSYANTGGTGNRTAIITVTTDAALGGSSGVPGKLVDGSFNDSSAGSIWFTAGQSGKHVTFDFTPSGSRRLIQEAKYYQSLSASHGNWKWQGSDDGSSWTDLSAAFDWNGAVLGTVIGDLSANVVGYYYYRLTQTSGTTSSAPWMREMEFKIDSYVGAVALAGSTTLALGDTGVLTLTQLLLGSTTLALSVTGAVTPELEGRLTIGLSVAGSLTVLAIVTIDGDTSLGLSATAELTVLPIPQFVSTMILETLAGSVADDRLVTSMVIEVFHSMDAIPDVPGPVYKDPIVPVLTYRGDIAL